MKNKTSQSGFTLIELIAVMVILGILAAVIVPRLTTLTSGAYESNVRNMYGLIKNEVTAQATKAAMTGDYLETFPEPATACTGCPAVGDMDAEHYYLIPGLETMILINGQHSLKTIYMIIVLMDQMAEQAPWFLCIILTGGQVAILHGAIKVLLMIHLGEALQA